MSVTDLSPTEVEEAPSRKKPLLIVAVVVIALAAAGWWFMIRPAGADEGPKPGEVLQLEPIQINLQDGHYLKIGVALQAVEGAEHVEGSKALDATIELFSGRKMADLADTKRRHRLKEQLLEELDHRYHGEVMEVYFTDFVTQ
ncbi:MAG TPA: flagellar basal body-associated FliL family protein [Nocardioidaceae bacterium]|nr:flagellar basal body-associated FliL family protein [Nocardioidaceae bacterium]